MSDQKTLAIKTDAVGVLVELRRALRQVIARLPGDLRRPKDLQIKLKLEYKLCWQVINITRTEDPLAISQFVPGVTSVKKLLAAVRPLGVPEQLLQDVDVAMKEFVDVVKTHSDDRRGFDSMVTAMSGGEGAELIALQHRRDAFRNESQIWGSQVETFLRQMIVRKSANGTGYDRVFVNAKYGLRALRQGVMPIIHGYRDISAGRIQADQVLPLDIAAQEKYGAPVLPEFCTQPIPSFKTFQHTDGWIHNVLTSDQIGRKGAVNMVFGGVVRDVKIERDNAGTPALLCGATVIIPTELAVIELMVHRESFGQLTPQIWVHGTASGAEIPEVMRMTQQLPIYEEVLTLGAVDSAVPVQDVPVYREQLDHVFDLLDWDPAQFDLFRLRIPYPILHTRARITCQLAEENT